MIFQSRITLKGREKDLIVAKATAEKVQEVWGDTTKPRDFLIQLKTPSTMFLKGDIRFIDLIKDGTETDFQDEVKKSHEEENRTREAILKRPAEIRATDTTIFEGLYKVAAGMVPPSDLRTKVMQIQTEFFKNNPRRTICDPSTYLSLIPKQDGSSSYKLWSHTPVLFQAGYLRIVERAVLHDMIMSR